MTSEKEESAMFDLRGYLVGGVVRLAAIVAAVATAAAIFVPAVVGIGKSDAALACGGQSNDIETEFNIARPGDIWRIFPAMLRAPELEADTEPAHVVVFRGAVNLDAMVRAPGAVPVVTDAVCVVQGDGTVNLYDSVSKAGATLP
jgi:hypothetical protein